MLPSSTPAASWSSTDAAWRAISGPGVLTIVGILTIAALATQVLATILETESPLWLTEGQSRMATALLFLAGVLWAIAIVFVVFSIAAAIFDTVVIVGLIASALWILGKMLPESDP